MLGFINIAVSLTLCPKLSKVHHKANSSNSMQSKFTCDLYKKCGVDINTFSINNDSELM